MTYKEDMNFKPFVSETGKVAVSARILSSNVEKKV
jgi:hypothetical protein